MGTPYTGVPANVSLAAAAQATVPVDGDSDAAATFTVGTQKVIDYVEAIRQQVQVLVAATWQKQTSGTARTLFGVAGTPINGLVPKFIAVGDAAAAPPTILTSEDGVTWTSRTAVGTSTAAFAVGYRADGAFAVVLANGASGQNVMTSTDGSTWTLRTSNIALASQQGGVVWSPTLSLWCIVGGVGGAAAVATSPDGITWTARTLGAAADQMVAVTWSPSLALFIAVGFNTGTNAPEIFTSADGTTWTARTVPTAGTNKANAVAWAPVPALAMMITSTDAWTSADAITWTKKTNGFVLNNAHTGLVHTGTEWLATGVNAAYYLVESLMDASPAATGWVGRRERDQTISINGIAVGLFGTLIVVGGSGTIWTGVSAKTV